MRAVVQDGYGASDVLRVREVERPVAGDGEVLVQVRAAALNAFDWHAMRGDPYLMRLMLPAVLGLGRPRRKIRGRDFAGVVAAVGAGVTGWRCGDEVYGDAGERGGTFAEYVAVAADMIERKPAGLTFEQAAAMPLAGTTALVCLRDAGRVGPGQRVLVNGASGGVGTFAVQIAKALGATVTAVCSTRNVGLVRTLGADRIVDYTRADFAQAGRRYDVVVDLVGNRSLADLRRVLEPGGTLILSGGGTSGGAASSGETSGGAASGGAASSGGTSGGGASGRGSVVGPVGLLVRGRVVGRFVRQRVLAPGASPSRAHLAALGELVAAGKVAPVIDRTYALEETGDAMRYLEVEHARAKVVIVVAGRPADRRRVA